MSSLAHLNGFIGWKNASCLRSVALLQNGWDNRSTLFVSIASLSRSRIDSQSSVAAGILRVNLLEKRIRVLRFVHEFSNLRAEVIPALGRDLEESAPATQTSKPKPESLTMRELKPYQTVHGLENAIDNGGRFYNLFNAADDSVVSRGELAKAAGVYSIGTSAFLFLEMAQQNLTVDDQQTIIKLLETKLRKQFLRDRPLTLLPSAVDKEGVEGRSLIICGFPRFVENRNQFKVLVMVPVMVGGVMVPFMVPIFDKFDVYEVFDDKQMKKPNSMVATVRGKRLDHDGPIRFGGVLRKLDFEDKTQKTHQYFLETLFYTKL